MIQGPPPPTVKDSTIPRVLAIFGIICAVLMTVAVLSVRNINRAVTTSDWVNNTHAVINELAGLSASLQAGEGNLRLHALTGDPRDQAACRRSYAQMSDQLEVVKALTRGEQALHQRILGLEAPANARAQFARDVMTARMEDRTADAAALLAADAGRDPLIPILAEIDKLKTGYMDLLAGRDKAAYLQAETTRWTVWTGVGINFALLGGAGWLMISDIKFRRKAAAALEEANVNLETRVRERTAELSAANGQLSVENLQHRWANHSLEHQLRYDQFLFNSISDLVMVITKAGNISRLNPAVSHLSGWDAVELINRPLAEFVQLAPQPGDTRAGEPDPVGRAMQDGHDLRERPATLRDRDAREHPVRLALFPLRDGNKVVGGVVTMRTLDTTKQAGT